MSETTSRLTRALDGLYDALEHGSDWQETVRCGAEATGAERFNLITAGGDGAARQFSHPFDPDSALEYLTAYLPRDIRLPRLAARPSGLVTTRDLMSEDEIARCPVHQEFYRRHPECWNMTMVFGRSQGGIVAVTAHRRQDRPALDRDEEAALMVLANQVARIAHLKDILPSGAIAREGALAAFDGLPDPVAIFDVNGLVIHLNPAARSLVDSRNGLRLAGRRLMACQPEVTDAITRAVARTIRVITGRSMTLPSPVAVPHPAFAAPLFLRFFATPSGNGGSRYGVVKFVDPAARRIPDITFVRSATGLSNGEAALAIGIYRGLTVKAFASEAGLSEQTIRKRLKHVCDKLGVHRQPEIATLIAALASV
ncbi:helix-turn-helix transcriptional regulator [Aurantimonas sp. 22II-16-19i]|uniref:helix-turn-helix transcriptional regulator n=1 Tax=Aurantimonas sp. 22II-16-19i TaxID=1317114 RepID=UPI0009F7C143|nr:helix-turn-helix transcriptional regulator [Aurantimonas sp. 22II-16-19i]ORE89902.1 regulatory protein LuxR [Aurantimonas sp. 22II-16-19i]